MGKKTKTGKGRLDKFYHLAKEQGYRARSAFKLVQLAKKFDFLSKSKICIDLCAAPGGWSQVAQKHMASGSKIIAIDLAPIKPIHGVVCIQSDITSDKCRSLVRKEMSGNKADCVLHDGAPNVGKSWASDAYVQNELTLHALRCACEHLKQGGTFVTKVFRSADYNSLLWVFNQLFNKVDATKPTASRNVSAEIFVMCMGFKAGKIDPRFFDPKWVFMETLDSIAETTQGGPKKGQSATLNDLVKQQKGRHRGGYEPGDDMRTIAAHEFIASTEPAKILVTHHRLMFDHEESMELASSELTTKEIKDICDDLKVSGKRDLSLLLKWRMKILRERERVQKKAAADDAEKNAALALAARKAGVPAGSAIPQHLKQDVDNAIAQYLQEGVAKAQKRQKEEDDEDGLNDADLEMELAEHLEKRRKEEKREAKRMMVRQKRSEWRKKMSLHGGKNPAQDQPELFRGNERSVEALEDEDKYIDPSKRLDSDEEQSAESCDSDTDSDEGLDRTARMEVDLAVEHELRKMRSEENFRNSMQRQRKKKKETRRQQVMKAWAGELTDFNNAIDAQNEAQRALRDREDEEDEDDEDSDDDGSLFALREAQAEERLKLKGSNVDAEALVGVVGGPPKATGVDYTREAGSLSETEGGDEPPVKKQRRDPALDGALVPIEETETALKAVHRTSRWFSQDIFANAALVPSSQLEPLYKGDVDDKTESEDEGNIQEVPDDKLPQLPLTDKEKRKRARKKEQERKDRLAGKNPAEEDEDRGPMEIAPMEPPKPLVPAGKQGPKKPTDPKELAETLALGSILVNSKKARMELIDAGYNRYTFEGDEGLPDWFTEEEKKHNKPELPISKELMAQFRAKLREINARPIRKVAEARARKKRRLQKRMEKLRSTAMSLADNADLSELAKARQMRRAISKAAKSDQRKVTTVAIKKGGGGKRIEKGKAPKGAKLKIVDKRMKSDRRGEKKANARNKHRAKQIAQKVNKIKSKGRRGAGTRKVMKEPKNKGRSGLKSNTA